MAKKIAILVAIVSFLAIVWSLPVFAFNSSSTDFFVRGDVGYTVGNSTSTGIQLFSNGQWDALSNNISGDFEIIPGIIRAIFQPVKPIYTLIHYHWRNDNGSETTASSATGGIGDTPLTGLVRNTSIRLRMEITNDGGTVLSYAPQSFQLQYGLLSSTCSAISSWTTVGSSGAVWSMYNSTNLTDGSSTTDIATSTGGVADANHTFIVANAAVKTTTSTVAAISVPSDSFIETEFDIQALSSSTPNATYCFQLTNNGSANNFSYAQYPEATLLAESITLTLNTATVNLPALSPGIAVSATTTATVNVSGASGYTVSIQRNPATATTTLASGTIQFADYTPVWVPPGSTCAPGGNSTTTPGNTFSFRVASSGTTADHCPYWWGTNDTGTALYAGVPTTTQIIVNSTSTASQNGTTTVTILYSANAPSSQKATSYTGGVTITAIANP